MGRVKMSGIKNSEGEKCEERDKTQRQFPRVSLFIPVLLCVFRVHPDLTHAFKN